MPLRAMAEHLGATDLKSARDLLNALDEPKLAKLISNGVKVYATKTSKAWHSLPISNMFLSVCCVRAC